MNAEPGDASPLEVINAINEIDSALFGMSFDVFKIRLLIAARLSARLKQLGFDNDHAKLCLDFRQVEYISLDMTRPAIGPIYLEDGDLAAVDLFGFESIEIKKAGSTFRTQKIDEYGEMRDLYQLSISFGGFSPKSKLEFRFATLQISTFDPLDFGKTDGAAS